MKPLSKLFTLFAGQTKKDVRDAIDHYGYPHTFDLGLLHHVVASLKDDEYAVLLVRQTPKDVTDFDLYRINVKPSEDLSSVDTMTVEDVLGKGAGK